MRKLLVLAMLLATLAACTCKDGAMISGFDRGYDPCGMNCVDRDGKDCKCSARCPCWQLPAGGGQRRHLKSGEKP